MDEIVERPEFITVKEVAYVLGLKIASIRRMMNNGAIPTVEIENKPRIPTHAFFDNVLKVNSGVYQEYIYLYKHSISWIERGLHRAILHSIIATEEINPILRIIYKDDVQAIREALAIDTSLLPLPIPESE